jgi:hypothetical protein
MGHSHASKVNSRERILRIAAGCRQVSQVYGADWTGLI